MKRHPYLIPFSRFHRSILFLALIAKRNAPPVKGYPLKLADKVDYAIQYYEQELMPHFNSEELHVFSFVEQKDAAVDKLINELRGERIQLAMLFEKIKCDNSNFECFYQIGLLLEQHVRKEERKLYELIQVKFPKLLDQLSSSM